MADVATTFVMSHRCWVFTKESLDLQAIPPQSAPHTYVHTHTQTHTLSLSRLAEFLGSSVSGDLVCSLRLGAAETRCLLKMCGAPRHDKPIIEPEEEEEEE